MPESLHHGAVTCVADEELGPLEDRRMGDHLLDVGIVGNTKQF
jgi:hypothetical protein